MFTAACAGGVRPGDDPDTFTDDAHTAVAAAEQIAADDLEGLEVGIARARRALTARADAGLEDRLGRLTAHLAAARAVAPRASAPPRAHRVELAQAPSPAGLLPGVLSLLDPPCAGKHEADDRFGEAIAVGDFNGDGFADVAVGVPGEDRFTERDTGFVHVFRGSATGLAPWFGLSQAGLGADEANDRFGAALAAGDFDGDGKDDLAVGAPGEEAYNAPSNSGYVFTFRGGVTGLTPWGEFGQTLGADEANDRFGAALAAGDLDGDGDADLVVGTPGEDTLAGTDVGYVWVHRGGPTGLQAWYGLHHNDLAPAQDGESLGAVLALGDWNGDGRAELAAGVPAADAQAGAVYVFVTEAVSPNRMHVTQRLNQTPLGSNEAGDHFGSALAAGDFNGDGKDDLAVGAPDEEALGLVRSGFAFVFRAGASGLTAWAGLRPDALIGEDRDHRRAPAVAGGRLGRSMIAGDLDGDGKADLIIGRDHHQTMGPDLVEGAGQLFLFRGTTGGPVAWGVRGQSQLGADEAGDDFGRSLAIGDLDGDGRLDLVVGAPGEDPGAPRDAGYAFAFRGEVSPSVPSPWTGLSQQKSGCAPTWPAPPQIELVSKTDDSIRLRFVGGTGTTDLAYSLEGTYGTVYDTVHAATYEKTFSGLSANREYCAEARRLWSTSPDYSDAATMCVTTNASSGGGGGGGGDPGPQPYVTCGLCNSGWHIQEYVTDPDCGTAARNANRCVPNEGLSFPVCSVNVCPSGYHAVDTYYGGSCDYGDPGPLSDNTTSCVQD